MPQHTSHPYLLITEFITQFINLTKKYYTQIIRGKFERVQQSFKFSMNNLGYIIIIHIFRLFYNVLRQSIFFLHSSIFSLSLKIKIFKRFLKSTNFHYILKEPASFRRQVIGFYNTPSFMKSRTSST